MKRKSSLTGKILLGASLCLSVVFSANAQDSNNLVSTKESWSVFRDEGGQASCWAVSAPVKVVNTRNGQAVDVRRGDIMLYATFTKDQPNAIIAFTSGYPFRDGSKVSLRVGSSEYDLFTKGEWAWPASPQDDKAIVDAFKRGVDAVLVGVSGRGTTTTDTFSLIGFTAAHDDARALCD